MLEPHGLKDKPACGRFKWNAARLAGDPVPQSRGISPARSAPAAVLLRCCSLKKIKKHHLGPLSCRKLPKIPASPYRGLSTFISDAFGQNDMAYWKCLRQSSVRWNKYFGPRALWLFWQDMHLLPGKAGGIHVLHFFAEPSFKQINYRRVYGCKDKVYT